MWGVQERCKPCKTTITSIIDNPNRNSSFLLIYTKSVNLSNLNSN